MSSGPPWSECVAVILLNTCRRIKGNHLVSIGTMDTLLVHPREIFRVAIMVAASAIILAHNHPSGDANPSEADIRVTRDLIRAGQLLKLEVLDHVIIGNAGHTSLRSLGYFHSQGIRPASGLSGSPFREPQPHIRRGWVLRRPACRAAGLLLPLQPITHW